MFHIKTVTTLLLTLLIIGSCSTIKGTDNFIKTELYFGLSQDTVDITEDQWASFKESVLDKEFEGYNEVNCNGVWTGADKNTISENCKVIVYLNKGSAEDQDKINLVINAYKNRFNQESVLCIETKVKANF